MVCNDYLGNFFLQLLGVSLLTLEGHTRYVCGINPDHSIC